MPLVAAAAAAGATTRLLGLLALTAVATAAVTIPAPSAVLPRGAVWKYLSADLADASWSQTAFADGAWKSGPGVLGFGSPNVNTIIDVGGVGSARKRITMYFRRSFVFNKPAFAVGKILLELLVDDGAIVYLNGAELLRTNMPTGAVAFSTLASSKVDALSFAAAVNTTLDVSKLLNGTNVLAVELHQESSQSADGVFSCAVYSQLTPSASSTATASPSLTASRSRSSSATQSVSTTSTGTATGTSTASASAFPTGPDQIKVTDVWRFWDRGSAPDSAWTSITFDDAAWKSGRGVLGYGDSDIMTTVDWGTDPAARFTTTYFRKSINFRRAVGVVYQGNIRLNVDDGAVVYVNGVEVSRVFINAGPVTYATRASRLVEGAAERTYATIVVPDSAIVSGNNVVAVEVHQYSTSSNDLRFDLSLFIDVAPARDASPSATSSPAPSPEAVPSATPSPAAPSASAARSPAGSAARSPAASTVAAPSDSAAASTPTDSGGGSVPTRSAAPAPSPSAAPAGESQSPSGASDPPAASESSSPAPSLKPGASRPASRSASRSSTATRSRCVCSCTKRSCCSDSEEDASIIAECGNDLGGAASGRSSSSGATLSGGALGGLIGGIVAVAAIVGVLLVLRRRLQQRRATQRQTRSPAMQRSSSNDSGEGAMTVSLMAAGSADAAAATRLQAANIAHAAAQAASHARSGGVPSALLRKDAVDANDDEDDDDVNSADEWEQQQLQHELEQHDAVDGGAVAATAHVVDVVVDGKSARRPSAAPPQAPLQAAPHAPPQPRSQSPVADAESETLLEMRRQLHALSSQVQQQQETIRALSHANDPARLSAPHAILRASSPRLVQGQSQLRPLLVQSPTVRRSPSPVSPPTAYVLVSPRPPSRVQHQPQPQPQPLAQSRMSVSPRLVDVAAAATDRSAATASPQPLPVLVRRPVPMSRPHGHSPTSQRPRRVRVWFADEPPMLQPTVVYGGGVPVMTSSRRHERSRVSRRPLHAPALLEGSTVTGAPVLPRRAVSVHSQVGAPAVSVQPPSPARRPLRRRGSSTAGAASPLPTAATVATVVAPQPQPQPQPQVETVPQADAVQGPPPASQPLA